MATFFMFGKYTSEAVKGLSAARTEKGNKLVEKNGGKVSSIHALMGDTDLVIIATFPDAARAMKSSIALSRLTGIAFSTCEAVPVKDFDKMIAEI
jgi:uncharacterized protein with GYD domain